ncbi:hypothetical protein [Pseudomonas sp. G5(2012)]|uniref:hypothetical protein n=1 Tax=Pseudomonas sp. G5(2012) TaxID=1268068 RepID=UPI0005B39C0D|nr:hypothetical protein [Pseudomonas sp. G5(2012)]
MHLCEEHTTDAVISAAIASRRSSKDLPRPGHIGVEAVLDAIEGGWFELPAGRNLCYTQSQYFRLANLVQCLPAVTGVQERSRAWSATKRQQLGDRFTFVFGLPNTLPDIEQRARGLPYGGPRRPLEFTAGKYQAIDLLQWLQDAVAITDQLNALMDALEPQFMFDTQVDIEQQVAHLAAHGQVHYLDKYLYALRRRFLWREDERWLREVKAGAISISEFDARVAARDGYREQENRSHWMSVYERIRQLASYLEHTGSYHHGTLTRRLRERFGRSARLLREHSSGGLILELDGGPSVGSGQQLEDGVALVNFVCALADLVKGTPPDVHCYFAAVDQASSRLNAASSPSMAVVRRIETIELQEAGLI